MDEMIYAQTKKPRVGELFTFYSNPDVVVAPDFITTENFVSVKVYDIFGRLVYAGETASFDENSLQNGVYMLQYLTSNGGSKTVKINILK